MNSTTTHQISKIADQLRLSNSLRRLAVQASESGVAGSDAHSGALKELQGRGHIQQDPSDSQWRVTPEGRAYLEGLRAYARRLTRASRNATS